MGNLINKLKQADDAAVFGQIDDREQAVVDRHRQKAPGGFRRRLADADAKAEIDTRRQQRAYAEQAPPEVIQPAKEMLTNLGDRQKVLETFRKLSPEQRQEALKLAPGLAQQLGDDRGGAVGRTLGAVSRGISHGVSQPISELIGTGGTPEEIEYIRQLDAAASQEFSPARPGDPWYQSGPLQAAEMAPWMATVVGGAGVGRAIATGAAKPVAAQMATRAGLGRATLNAAGKAGELAGITAASFPPQYAQEVDQLKEIGMQDGTQLRLLAAGTAAITGLVEGIVPNPFKTGPVPLTEGAVKAARSYLWEAAKRAPGEMSEEYLQGVTSGLGKTVAGYLDENAEDKSVADAFKNGWEQAKEAALPMAFLLGVPAIGGAGLSAARAQRLQQAMAKGFVSSEDAKELGIVGKNRPERMANAQAELEQLNRPTVGQMPPSGPPALPEGSASPDLASPPGALPPTGAIPPAMPPAVQPPRIPGPTQVKPPLPTPSTSTPGTATPPAATEAATPESPVEQPKQEPDSFEDYANEWNRDLAKRLNKPERPITDNARRSLKEALENTADEGITNGSVTSFASDNPSLDEMRLREVQNAVRRKGYEATDITRSTENGVEYVGFTVSKKPTEATTATPKPADPVSELDQAEDELAGLFGEEETPKPTEKPPKAATAPTTQPGWEIVESDGGKLFRENQDPNLKPSQRISTRVAVDPSENVLATKDRFGKPIPPEILAARQEFVDKAKPGAEFEIKGFPGQTNTVQDDGSLLNTSDQGTKRVMGNVQSRANQVKPGDITWKETPRATPTPAAPAVDAETKGTAATPKEATVDRANPEALTEGFKALPEKGQAAFETEWTKGGTSIKNILYPENKNYRAEFEARTGIKLPKGVGSTFQAVEDWHNAGRPLKPISAPTESAPEQPPVKPPAKLGTKGAIKPARKMEPTEEGRPADGKPVMPGDRFVTNTGRETTPFPKYSGSSNRQSINTEKKSQLWLIENAIAEAESRGDDFNLTTFRGELETARKGKLPQASKDSATLYVFGDYVPKAPKPITKPLVEKTPEVSPIGDKTPTAPPAETTQTSADQVNVDSGAESKVKPETPAEVDDFTAAVNAAFDERFGDVSEEETPKPPKKGRKKSPTSEAKPEKKTLSEKAADRKERTSAAKAEKLAKFKDLLKKKNIIKAVYDPKEEAKADVELLTATVELTAAAIDDGVSTFAEYVAWIVDSIGESATRTISPYLEAGWARLGTYNRFRGKIDSAGKVADILTERSNGTNDTGTGAADQAAGEQDRRDGQDAISPTNANVLEGTQAENGGQADEAGDTGRVRNRPGGKVRRGSGKADSRGVNEPERSGTEGRGSSTDDTGERGAGIDRAPQSTRPNYHLTNPEAIIGGGPKAKFARNRKAIEIVRDLEETGRPPTAEELDTLAGYTGWGAFGQELFQGTWEVPQVKKGWEEENEWLRIYLGEEDWKSANTSIVNAHYTDPQTVTAMWDMLRRMGFNGGRVLEPSMGIGNFFSLMPRDLMDKSNLTGIELDTMTAKIAKLLHPQANIQQKGYQESQTPNDFYDVILSNVPFGNYKIADRRYKQDFSIHNYFFKRAFDQVKPGGVIAFLTSNMTMDGKTQAKLMRAQIAEQGDLVTAIRLPSGAFQAYAGTKVVADLIIIRKRKPGENPMSGQDWIDVVEMDTPAGQKISANEYWEKNPKNILGTMTYGHGTTSGRPGMIVQQPADLQASLDKAVQSVPEGIIDTERTATQGRERPNTTAMRQNSVLSQDNDLWIVKGEQLVPLIEFAGWFRQGSKQATIDKNRKEIEGLLDVREAMRAVLDQQAASEDATSSRADLNRVYDAFVSKHGPIGKSAAAKHLRKAGDPMANTLLSLEKKEGTKYVKRAIFERPTVRQRKKLDNPTINDAFAMERNRSLDLDMERIATAAKVPVDEVIRQLESDGKIYKTGTGTYDAADVFLGGNMARKLRQLEAAKAEGMEGLDKSIEAVRERIPTPTPYSQIESKLGATWVQASDYADFLSFLLNEPSEAFKVEMRVQGWKVTIPTDINNKTEAQHTHGHRGIEFSKLMNAGMNNATVKLTMPDPQNPDSRITDPVATAEANAKIGELREKFSNWIWTSPDRITRLSGAFNEEFNSTAKPEFDDVPLDFEGLALQRGDQPFNLRSHQESAVWQGIVNGKGIFAHEVGTGKTLTMAALAMELRRLGLADKVLLGAHNANSLAVRNEIQEAYPNANVLYVDNLDAKNKDATLQSIATENWDVIVVPHSMAERFQLRPDTVRALLKPEMDALEAAALEAFEESEASDYAKGNMPADLDAISEEDLKKLKEPTAKELVKERMKLKAKIDEAVQAMDKGTGIFFEDMGIDTVMIDEAHLFKKLPITTKQNIKGLNKKASEKGTMMMMVADYIRANNNGRGVYLFTGTPITNTINEIFNMMRFVMAEEMEASGVRSWDGWFNNFAMQETNTELSSGGTWENFDRLSSFVNLPELRQMVGQYMDIVFADDMPEFKPRENREGRSENPVGRPYKQIHNVTVGMIPAQEQISEELKQRYTTFKNASGKEKVRMMREPGSKFNPLIIEGEGVKLAMDPRLTGFGTKVENGQLVTNEALLDPKNPNLKINKMLHNAMAHYHEHPQTSQMIFMQIGHNDWTTRVVGRTPAGKKITERVRVFNMAREIKRRLIEEGVPEHEIAMFSTMTKEKRTETAQLMKEGKVRFAIGSTETMGTGINAQDELIAMHHLDAPWMPGDLEQRNGRGHRQGNKWNTVHEYRYLTEGPQDGRRWQVLLTKSRFIEKFMKADGTERTIDMDDVDMSDDGSGTDMEKTFSAAAGDPRIMMRIRLEDQVAKLERSRNNHARTITETVSRANQKLDGIKNRKAEIEMLRADHQTWMDNRPAEGDKPSLTLTTGTSGEGMKVSKVISGLQEINDALKEREERYRNTIGAEIQIGEYRGVPLFMNNGMLYLGAGTTEQQSERFGSTSIRAERSKASWSMSSLQGVMANIPSRITRLENAIGKDQRFIDMAHKAVGEPFPKQKQLDAKRTKLDALNAEMNANPDISPAWLRAGAPIGTAVFHKGVEYEVAGHRKDTEILYSDGDNFVALPANELTDKEGTPLFPELQETDGEQGSEAKPKTKLGQAAEKANQELADAEKALRDTLRGKLGANLLIHPQVVAAAAKVVAKAIKAGTLNFAELMERMITKYGEAKAEQMRAVLQQEWDKQVNSNPIAEDGIPPNEPQPHPELVQPEAIPLTSVKNAIVDELRSNRGQDLMPEVTPQTVQQWLEVAGNRIANDPYAGNTLVEQLLTGNKTSVDEMEGMVLQYHYRAVNNLFEAADAKLTEAKANGDPAEIAIAQDEARVIMRRLSAIETALDKAGTAWGRAGVSRQIFLKQDFSLASMVRRARVANAGNELSDEQVAIISEQAKQIENLQKKIAELEAKTSEQEQTKVIDDAIKADIDATKKKTGRKSVRRENAANAVAAFKAEWASLFTLGATYDPRREAEKWDKIVRAAGNVVKAYVELGISSFSEFIASVKKDLGDVAESSREAFVEAWEVAKDKGNIAQPGLDITNPGQLTRFARNVQRTLIENGIREREEIVDGVHEALQEIIPEITRRQAMDALSSYGQFSQLSKDPIDQIIRDINGQLQQLAKLEDMEQGIAPAKTGVERRSQSDEERRLTQMVNEAKRRGGFVVTDPETQLKSAMAAAKTAVRNRIADMTFELTPKPDGTYSRIVRGKTEPIPDAELEQLRKERDELQKVHKEMFPPKGATQAQKIASASRALDAAIASLEAKLAVGDISPAPQPTPLSTPELDAKRAKLKQLNAQRDALRKIANPGMTAEQIKIRALDKSIAELEKQLATGNFAPKPKSAPLTSPEINARQAKLEELRATKKAILAAANPKMTPEQRAARAYEAHLRKQLAIYMEKIAQDDFAPTPKKQPRVLTKAELDLKKQLADVKNDFFEALARYHLENLSPGERAIDAIRESAHLSRAIMTSVDLSAVLRQGGLGVYSHPVMAKKAAAEMWHAIWSREAEFQSIEKLRMRPNAQLYEESGLNITDSEGKLTRQEEAFMGRWARTGIDFAGAKVQAASKYALEPVAASARAYVTFINNLRADLFDVMVENLGPGGQVTKEEAQVIASYINVATGRSDLKSLNEKAATLNTVFFAPRYVASRFQYLAMPFYVLGSRKNSVRVKKLIAQEYARTFTGAAVFIGSLTALAYLAAGGDDDEEPSVELNPLSSDFAKVRIGETRIDPMAGLAQVIVFSSRMAAFNTKNSVTGKVKPFYDGGRYETTHLSEAWRFTRTKLAPVPGAVVTAFSGMKNVVGDDVTPAGLVGGLFFPISAGEFLSTMEHRGIPKGLALNVLNLMGASVNTYGPKTAYLDATPEERTKMVNEYIKTMNWESDLPAFSQYLKPEELKQVQNRQDERRGDLVFEAMGSVLPKENYKTEVHFEEAQERLDKASKDFEEFQKQYAPTITDAIRYLTHHFDSEGGIKLQGSYKLKPSFKERRTRLEKHYQSLPQ